jgi:L-lactate utilization protein LutC
MSYDTLPSESTLQRTAESVKARGIKVEIVATKEEALEHIKALIPAGTSVMTGASITLTQIGLDDLLISGSHPWKNLKTDILAEKDPAKQSALRKQAVLADTFLGSVHAISETGELVIASATGSQIPSYAFTSEHVIWVAGTQKITASLEDAIQRVRQYVVPLEDKHMKDLGAPGTTLGKLLIFEKEVPFLQRQVTLILVKEILGF